MSAITEVAFGDLVISANVREKAVADAALVASVKAKGLIQPIVVFPADDDGKFTIVAGHRRFDALKKAGTTATDLVPVHVRHTEAGTTDRVALQFIENQMRENLDAIDQGLAIQAMYDEGLTKEAVAKFGISKTVQSLRVRLLRLPDAVQQLVRDSRIDLETADRLVGVLAGVDPDLVAAAIPTDPDSATWVIVDAVEKLVVAQKRKKGLAKAKALVEKAGGVPVTSLAAKHTNPPKGKTARSGPLVDPTDIKADQLVHVAGDSRGKPVLSKVVFETDWCLQDQQARTDREQLNVYNRAIHAERKQIVSEFVRTTIAPENFVDQLIEDAWQGSLTEYVDVTADLLGVPIPEDVGDGGSSLFHRSDVAREAVLAWVGTSSQRKMHWLFASFAARNVGSGFGQTVPVEAWKDGPEPVAYQIAADLGLPERAHEVKDIPKGWTPAPADADG